MQRTIYIAFLILLFSNCQKQEERTCFKGTGDMVSETRALGEIQSLLLYDFIDYNLIQDSTDRVVVHCGENLLQHLMTELDQGTLRVWDDNRCHWLRSLPASITVDIHFTELKSIRNEGSGTLRTVGYIEQEEFIFDNYHSGGKNYLKIRADEATIRINAGGPLIEVEGETRHVNLRSSGLGKLHAEQLVSQSVWADNKFDGEIRLHVDGGTLWHLIDGYGNIYYEGEASEYIEVSALGDGELIAL